MLTVAMRDASEGRGNRATSFIHLTAVCVASQSPLIGKRILRPLAQRDAADAPIYLPLSRAENEAQNEMRRKIFHSGMGIKATEK